MQFKVKALITLKKSVLDPQGKAIELTLHNMNYSSVSNVRQGKVIEFLIDAENKDKASITAKEICEKLLANLIIEQFNIEITEV